MVTGSGSSIEIISGPVMFMPCGRPKRPGVPVRKGSFGSTTICCLTINRWVMGGILRCWQRSWDCNKKNSRAVCRPVVSGADRPGFSGWSEAWHHEYADILYQWPSSRRRSPSGKLSSIDRHPTRATTSVMTFFDGLVRFRRSILVCRRRRLWTSQAD